MKQTSCQITLSILAIVILLFTSLPVLSSEEINEGSQDSHKVTNRSDNVETSLVIARQKLGYAFDAYRKGDIDSTKSNLNVAIEWLHKAEKSSITEKARDETRKLATEIEEFKSRLNHESEKKENSLARFWHQATSIMKREADQLIHSYVELSISEETLKYLLDAKLHLFTAEHDLFVSHNTENASKELVKTIDYLNEASQVSSSTIQKQVIALSNDMQLLKEKLSTTEGTWINDSAINSLDKALKNLANIDENASPNLKLRIELIKADIRTLRVDVVRSNIKNNYESAMATLKKIINEL